jgi:Ni/Fe-hydrogenase subunit HybB-like protein
MKPNNGSKRWAFPLWMMMLLLFMATGLVAGLIIFREGLVVTNLNDLVPWGLWIAIDLSAIALAAGAFTLSAAVYLLRRKELMPLARTAVFVGFIGYTMAVLCLVMDIGRPDRFYMAWFNWNIHSPLWEVTMCVTFYLMVLTFEVLPLLGEASWFKSRLPRPSHWLHNIHRAAPILAVVGLCLSILHQSSLGLAYGKLAARPIWFRPGVTVLFFVSAVVAGPALVVVISRLASWITPKAKVSSRLLNSVARYVAWALLVYTGLRIWDMSVLLLSKDPLVTEGLAMLTNGTLAINFWVGEIALGLLLPLFILWHPRLRNQFRWQTLALFLVATGLVAYRWDTNMVGQLMVVTLLPNQTAPLYTVYRPALIEIIVSIAIVSYGLLMLTLGIRYLGIVDHGPAADPARSAQRDPSASKQPELAGEFR